MITEKPQTYKPFHYSQFFDYYKTALSTVWRPETVDMGEDINDFIHKSTEVERHVIKSILKTFTIMETHIGDYWTDRVCSMFPRYEIVAAARAFGFFEAIHAQAYDWLNSSLGLEEYEAFLGDPVAMKKIGHFINQPNNTISLAIFSGAGEGVSLFSSFAVLLSLSLDGRYKGLQQIISWSVRDEALHSDMGCELFCTYVKEVGLEPHVEEYIYQGFQEAIINEFSFIDQIFSLGQLNNINSEDLKDYMLYRANNRLKKLGLKELFEPSGCYNRIREWFEPLAFGQADQDFFSTPVEGGNYSAILSQDYSTYDYSTTKVKDWNLY